MLPLLVNYLCMDAFETHLLNSWLFNCKKLDIRKNCEYCTVRFLTVCNAKAEKNPKYKITPDIIFSGKVSSRKEIQRTFLKMTNWEQVILISCLFLKFLERTYSKC